MNRREAIKDFVLMMGGTMVGANIILSGCAPQEQIEGLDFSPNDVAFLDEIGESIIPTTDTPGAKAVGIGNFMISMVKETYNREQQEAFVSGLNMIRREFEEENGMDFMEASLDDRTAYLNRLYQTSMSQEDREPKVMGMLKDLTVLGYFTSEIGATQQLQYIETPGRYDSCVPYEKGDRLFAI